MASLFRKTCVGTFVRRFEEAIDDGNELLTRYYVHLVKRMQCRDVTLTLSQTPTSKLAESLAN